MGVVIQRSGICVVLVGHGAIVNDMRGESIGAKDRLVSEQPTAWLGLGPDRPAESAVLGRPRAGGEFGTAKVHALALAAPLSLTVKRPLAAPLKVPLLIHSMSAALTVE